MLIRTKSGSMTVKAIGKITVGSIRKWMMKKLMRKRKKSRSSLIRTTKRLNFFQRRKKIASPTCLSTWP